MDLQLKGLRAVVTGGSSGIGAAIVRALATEGCEVVFCARDLGSIEAALRAMAGLPGRVSARPLDGADTPALRDWLGSLGGFDIFVPNVSALSGDWAQAIRSDFRATVEGTVAAVAWLQRTPHAAITSIGFNADSLAAPTSTVYRGANAALAHYMKSLSALLLPLVRVNIESPGDTLVSDSFGTGYAARSPIRSASACGATPCSAWPPPGRSLASPPLCRGRRPALSRGRTGMSMVDRRRMCRYES